MVRGFRKTVLRFKSKPLVVRLEEENWGEYRQPKSIRKKLVTAFVMILILMTTASNLAPNAVKAATNDWNFGTPGNFSLGDGSKIEVTGGKAQLKIQENANDAQTAALYHMDETSGSSVADASSNSNTATLYGSAVTAWNAGKLNNGLTLDGLTNYLQTGDSASLSSTGNQSIEAWTKFDSELTDSSHNQRQSIADKGNYQLYYDHQTGKINYELEPSGDKTWTLEGGNETKGSWDLDGKYSIYGSAVLGTDLYVGLGTSYSDAEVWKWDGAVWSKVGGDGLNSSWNDTDYEIVQSMVSDGTFVYAGLGLTAGDADIWRYNGTSWTRIGGHGVNSGWAIGQANESVYSMTIYKGNLVAGLGISASDADVWIFNGTDDWTQIGGDSLKSGWTAGYDYVTSFATDADYLYAGLSVTAGEAEVWRYSDSTDSWTKIGGDAINSSWADATYEQVKSMVMAGTTLYAGLGVTAGEAEVWKTDNPTATPPTWSKVGGDGVNSSWDPVTAAHERVWSLTASGSVVYAGLGDSDGDAEIWKLESGTWSQIGGDAVDSSWNTGGIYAMTMQVYDSKLYVGALNSFYGAEFWSYDVLASPKWTKLGGNLTNNSWPAFYLTYVNALATYNGKLYAGLGSAYSDAVVYEYNGTSWTVVGGHGQNSSWSPMPTNTYEAIRAMSVYNGNLYVGMGSGVNDADVWKYNGSIWEQVGGDNKNSGWTGFYAASSFTVYNDMLCAGIGQADVNVWCWNDSSWTRIATDANLGATYEYIQTMQVYGTNLYVGMGTGTGDADVWMFNGATWAKIGGDGVNSSWNNGATIQSSVDALTVLNNKLYAGVGGSQPAEVWEYNGTVWSKIGGQEQDGSWTENVYNVYSLTTFNGDLYAGLGRVAPQGQVWKWDGSTWSEVGGEAVGSSWSTVVESVHAMTVYDGKLYAGLGDTINVDPQVWSYGGNAVLASSTVGQDTNWHHVAATYDGTTMKIYIDGVLDASRTISVTRADNSKALLIGQCYGNRSDGNRPGFFAGQLDEVRISSTDRSSFITSTYSTTGQTVQPLAAMLTNQVKSFDGFSADTLGGTGNVNFRLSANGGTAWKYWDNVNWVESVSISAVNSLAAINDNIADFPVTSGGILWQAVLSGNGEQQPVLNLVTVSYTPDTTDPINPLATLTAKNENGGSANLTTEVYYNYASPYFTWAAADDSDGIGVAGYYVYFGTNPTADPKSSKGIATELNGTGVHYQADLNFEVGVDSATITTGNTYYLRILAKDGAQNPLNAGTPSTLFTYKYETTAPSSSSGAAVSPSTWSATNSYNFFWSAWTDTESNLEAYYYQIKKADTTYSPGPTAADWTRLTDASVTLADVATEGVNVFYLRARDNAGNYSQNIPTNFYYNSSAPTAPQNLAVVGDASKIENAFAFTWAAPAVYSGEATDLLYYYSINTPPTAQTIHGNGNLTSLSEGPYATQQGDNTFYVVAKDGAENINYSASASVTFSATTTAPGQPVNPSIVDSSNRVSGDFRLTLTYSAPTSGGIVASYSIERSSDGVSYSSIGSTTSTGFIDSDLDSAITYYYKIYARDNAGATSAAPTGSDIVSKKPSGRYITPPEISSITSEPGTSNATINWRTDRVSDTFIDYGTTTAYGQSAGVRESVLAHEVTISGLTPGQMYHFKVQSLDSGDMRDYSESAGYSADYSFETEAAPGLSNFIVSDTTTNSAIISFDTNKAVSALISYGLTTDYGNTLTDDSAGSTTKHVVRLKDLQDGTTYQLKVTVNDESGESFASTGYIVQTLAMPKVTNIKYENLQEAVTTIKVTWQTNVPTTSTVKYAVDGGNFAESAASDLTSDHEINIAGLKDQSKYSIYALGRDQFGNVAESDRITFDTPADSRPPKIDGIVIEASNVGNTNTGRAQVAVSWKTDEVANSQVEYSEGISGEEYTKKTLVDANLSMQHLVIISDLNPGEPYHLRVVSADGAGNVTKGNDGTVITGEVSKSALQLILNTLMGVFGWMGQLIK